MAALSRPAAGAPSNQKREINGWAMYDWANSAFSTTVIAVFLGPYLSSLVEASAKASPDGIARFFGIPMAPESFFPFMASFSVAFQAGLLPILGAIADYSNRRREMLRLFAIIGALATLAMFFVQGELWALGGLLFVIANVAFGASIVFYNAFLPDIASDDQRDRVSSFGWAMGYLGGGLLLIVNLAIFLARDAIGISGGLAVRINLASAGLWWLLWMLFAVNRLQPRGSAHALPAGQTLLGVAFKQLEHTMLAPAKLIAVLLLSPLSILVIAPLLALTGASLNYAVIAMLGPLVMIAIFLIRKGRTLPQTSRFLLGYLIYNDGIQTVISTTATFAAAPLIRGGLQMPTVRLTLLVLMIQIMGFVGALVFGRLAKALGAKRALVLSLLIWTGAVIFAYVGLTGSETALALPDALGGPMPRAEAQFWGLGAIIATVLGGSQALSRSLFSRMIPKAQEAEYFSIYEISERGTSWMGPFVFAAVNQSYGNVRPAILSVVAFFVIGLAVLFFVNVRAAIDEAAQEER
jgi:MFS transporter, UMF1 family